MQNHEMKLQDNPFDLIEQNIKTIEYRLNDEKRKKIKVGDSITFHNINDANKMLKVIVIELRHYKDLLEMYKDTFNMYLKDYYNNPEEAVLDTPYYSNEEIEKYGCLGIIFKRL